jgi:hypothetical protein
MVEDGDRLAVGAAYADGDNRFAHSGMSPEIGRYDLSLDHFERVLEGAYAMGYRTGEAAALMKADRAALGHPQRGRLGPTISAPAAPVATAIEGDRHRWMTEPHRPRRVAAAEAVQKCSRSAIAAVRAGRPGCGCQRNGDGLAMALVSGLATAAGKLAGLSVGMKASAGIAVAVASIGTAGAAEVLPDPAQDRFDTVVESVTDNERPSPDPANQNTEFGQRVSDDARDGGVDGVEISDEARQLGDQHRPDQLPTPAPAEPGRPADLPTPDDPPADPGADRPTPAPTNPSRP